MKVLRIWSALALVALAVFLLYEGVGLALGEADILGMRVSGNLRVSAILAISSVLNLLIALGLLLKRRWARVGSTAASWLYVVCGAVYYSLGISWEFGLLLVGMFLLPAVYLISGSARREFEEEEVREHRIEVSEEPWEEEEWGDQYPIYESRPADPGDDHSHDPPRSGHFPDEVVDRLR